MVVRGTRTSLARARMVRSARRSRSSRILSKNSSSSARTSSSSSSKTQSTSTTKQTKQISMYEEVQKAADGLQTTAKSLIELGTIKTTTTDATTTDTTAATDETTTADSTTSTSATTQTSAKTEEELKKEIIDGVKDMVEQYTQKTDDGRFAMFYDPTMESTHRWPLCVTTSSDGLQFSDMHLVHGEVPPMRFGGFWKDYGPQYMRGIAEGIQRPLDKVCIAYTVNKEDVWIAMLPVPITGTETSQAFSADFSQGYDSFTVYSPKWAPVTAENGALRLRDFDRYDHAKAERVLYDAPKQTVTCTILPHQDDHGELYIELQDEKGTPGLRMVLRKDGELCVRQTALVPFYSYRANEPLTLKITADCPSHRFTLSINGSEEKKHLFMTAVESVSRFVLRTGAPRLTPTREDIPIEDTDHILPLADEKDREAIYDLLAFHVESSK